MKGNRSSAGETLPGAPLEWPPRRAAGVHSYTAPALPVARRQMWRRRSILLPSIALIGLAGVVVSIFVAFGGSGTTAATAPIEPDAPVVVALPGTPTPTPEPTSVPTPATDRGDDGNYRQRKPGFAHRGSRRCPAADCAVAHNRSPRARTLRSPPRRQLRPPSPEVRIRRAGTRRLCDRALANQRTESIEFLRLPPE